jgi:hypothetical protein
VSVVVPSFNMKLAPDVMISGDAWPVGILVRGFLSREMDKMIYSYINELKTR